MKVRELVRALQRAGFRLNRQTGSHAIFERDDGKFANVPIHTGDIPIGTLRNVLKTTGLSIDDVRELL